MVRFTKHALEKFQILEAHGFRVTKYAVEKTARRPELVDISRMPLMIAQRNFDKAHVLRVASKEEYVIILRQRAWRFVPKRDEVLRDFSFTKACRGT